ncbi:tetratricopeptide repeat protein [Pseudoalteromonas sp. MMG010]|uniref:tetratricopeptide repeat protein n=1 Tax=Pseudoalteromonas sp. MMG010 TaxID=2822685 RepID=UPI001B3A60D7|nr:tetratricopeptide repeat protein [Pseudoalteromonas sp. MMG010]MBQ4834665.1 tetratricopeptide repeat protein [Pseudoalteromonas sp. MMG010]
MSIRSICVFLVCVVSTKTFSAENFSDHERFCALQPKVDCLTYIKNRLTGESVNSLQWYKVKSYEFDYYFDYSQFHELITAVKPYSEQTNLPREFKSQVYYYYAKALLHTGNKKLAKEYAVKAFNELQGIFNSFKNPIRLVELANLQNDFGSIDTALQMLVSAERRFGKSKDPIFHFELQVNKGNVYHAMGDLVNAAKSRKLALDIILATGETSKIIVACNNLAYTYQLLKEYQLAIEYNLKALSFKQPANFNISRTKLRLAELFWLENNPAQAKVWLSQVNPSMLKRAHTRIYKKLLQALK